MQLTHKSQQPLTKDMGLKVLREKGGEGRGAMTRKGGEGRGGECRSQEEGGGGGGVVW